jgi:hypothetical protein
MIVKNKKPPPDKPGGGLSLVKAVGWELYRTKHPASAKRPAPGERMLMGIRTPMRALLSGALQRPAVAKRSSITPPMYEWWRPVSSRLDFAGLPH